MIIELKPLEQVSKEAYALLFEHLGVTDTLRFINQYRQGEGDYTAERRAQLDAEEASSEKAKAIKEAVVNATNAPSIAPSSSNPSPTPKQAQL